MDERMRFLEEITEAHGVSGYEQEVRSVIRKYLAGMTEITHDKLGSIICKKAGISDAPRVMLSAHMDEIGFMVKYITKEGFLKFTTLGGWWEQVMLGQRVVVKTRNGDLPGVIGSKPPHVLPAEERKKVVEKKDMFIDIGATGEDEAKKLGVRPGDPVVPYSTFTPMANEKFLMAKAWDNRMGCAMMIEIMRKLAGVSHPNTVYAVGTVQEEVGLRGATTSANVIEPDVAFALDVGVSGDVPGITEDMSATKLGKGAAISIYDTSLIPNLKLRDFVIDVAEEHNIPYQLDFSEGGGTDAGRIHIHAHGVPSVVIGVPARYIHSHNSVIHRDDLDHAIELMVAVIKRLDAATVKTLVEG